jgi:hypothetical protein
MDNENNVEQEDIETPAEEVEETEEVSEDTDEEEQEDLQAKLKELEETNKKLFARAKKAEEAKKNLPEEKSAELSSRDVLLLAGQGFTHEEDIEFLLKSSKVLGVPLAEAVKDDTVSKLLAERRELRKTAEATHTKTSRRGKTETSPEALVEQARRGQFPDDDDSIGKLVRAQIHKK